jgi:DNA-binding Xre family transcriptional regulator
MLYFNFARIFKLKGIHRPYKHMTTLGYSGNFATKMAHNDVSQMTLAMMERVCRDLNCTPNDILDFRVYENDTLPDDHALHTLKKKMITNEVMEKINTLPVEKIEQIHNMIKDMD